MCFKSSQSENLPLSALFPSLSILASASLSVSPRSLEPRVRYWFQVYSWRLVRFAGVKTSKGRGRVAAPTRAFQVLILEGEPLSRKLKAAPCRHTRESARDENPMVKLRARSPRAARVCGCVCVRRAYVCPPLKLLLAFWIWRNGTRAASRKSAVKQQRLTSLWNAMYFVDIYSVYVISFINFFSRVSLRIVFKLYRL